jgi:hypothetical protein
MKTIVGYPKFKAFDSAGFPLVGGRVYFYIPGSTTPKNTYSDPLLTTPNTNPVILDGEGEAVIYGRDSYKIVLCDEDNSEIWTFDNVYCNEWEGAVIIVPSASKDAEIQAIIDAASPGDLIVFLSTYEIDAPLRFNNPGVHYIFSGIGSCFMGTGAGAQIKASDSFVGDYVADISANDQIFENAYFNSNLKANIGLQITDCRLCRFIGVLNIEEPKQKGLYLKAEAAINADHEFDLVNVKMYETTETDARGYVCEGTSSEAGVTVSHIKKLIIGLKGVTTSYGVDFAKYADGHHIDVVQITAADGPLTAGVIFNSDTPDSDVNVYQNVIGDLIYEPGAYPLAIGNKAKERYPNIVGINHYVDGYIIGHRRNLKVQSWGTEPIIYRTAFDSLDGFENWSDGTGSAELYADHDYVSLQTGAETGGTGRIIKKSSYFFGIGWLRRKKFRTIIYCSSITNQTAYILLGLHLGHYLGFKIVDGDIYGCANDGTEALTDAHAISAETGYEIECHFNPGCEARFYVDGADIGAITTHLPTDASTTVFLINSGIIADADENKELRLSAWELEQEGL